MDFSEPRLLTEAEVAEVERIARLICLEMEPYIHPDTLVHEIEPMRLHSGGYAVVDASFVHPLWKRYSRAARAICDDNRKRFRVDKTEGVP